jgi:major type 1 subunit fimbrin (pilin)
MRWFELLVRRAGLRRMSGAIVGMMLLALSGHTWAASSCSGSAQTISVPMPASVSVPRDAAVGTLLSGWISTAQTTNYYNCTVSASTSTGTLFEPLSLTKSGLTITNAGVNYTVFNTNVPGVGIAVGIRAYINGCGWQAQRDLGTTSFTANPGWSGGACNQNGSFTNGGQASVILVKTGPVTAATTSGGVLFEAASYVNPSVLPRMRKSFSLTSTAITALSCSTPDMTVPMGSYSAAKFTGMGSSSPTPVPVNVAINNCPA